MLSTQEVVGYADGVEDYIKAGRFAEAETRARAADDGCFRTRIGVIRWYQGRFAELLPMFAEPVGPGSVVALALAAAQAGDRRLAAQNLARVRDHGLADMPREESWRASMYATVEAAHLLSDSWLAAEAYGLLAPIAGRADPAADALGSVEYSLGVAAMTMADIENAVSHLGAAVRDDVAFGHRPAAALARLRLGQALTARDGAGSATALQELSLAASEAAELGMVLSAAQVTCNRRGPRWHLAFGGRTATVVDSVGMRHLAVLLDNPGQEIRAVDLVSPATDHPRLSEQTVLDETALRQYRDRLADLESEIEEYEAANDLERATSVRTERDWLLAELSSAAGISGRTRRFSDAEERARIAVGKAIRRVLDRISAADPVIGAELRVTISTGLRCSYRPH